MRGMRDMRDMRGRERRGERVAISIAATWRRFQHGLQLEQPHLGIGVRQPAKRRVPAVFQALPLVGATPRPTQAPAACRTGPRSQRHALARPRRGSRSRGRRRGKRLHVPPRQAPRVANPPSHQRREAPLARQIELLRLRRRVQGVEAQLEIRSKSERAVSNISFTREL